MWGVGWVAYRRGPLTTSHQPIDMPEHKTIKHMKEEESIVIVPADHETVTVVVDYEDYVLYPEPPLKFPHQLMINT